jgi:hypothetical protein
VRSIRGLTLVLLICVPALFVPGASQSADVQTNVIRIEYDPPKLAAHQSLYEMVKEHRVLEKLREVFAPFQLPFDLTFKMTGCDGQSNAWYARPTLTICYEYLDEIRRDMPKETTAAGVTPNDAAVGQFFYAAAHEMGHAVFDLYSVPLFGRPEDAADQFAGYIMLQFGKSDARRLILGAAHSYKKYVSNPTVTAPLKAFSDWHGAPAQRFYNLLCLAYGADPVLFADLGDEKFLPKVRARGCKREYGEVAYAFNQLILPHLDRELAKKVVSQTWLSEGTAKPPAN